MLYIVCVCLLLLLLVCCVYVCVFSQDSVDNPALNVFLKTIDQQDLMDTTLVSLKNRPHEDAIILILHSADIVD